VEIRFMEMRAPDRTAGESRTGAAIRLEPVAADAAPGLLAKRLHASLDCDASAAAKPLDEAMLLAALKALTGSAGEEPWCAYLASDLDRVVGVCGFKGAPDREGRAEIAYMTFPAFEGRGYATAMAAALTAAAFRGGVRSVCAHTLAEENASNRLLRRVGYVFAGETIDPDDGRVWRWERREH
jgi:ribosomal-protein-alanine N-acetyltransferase